MAYNEQKEGLINSFEMESVVLATLIKRRETFLQESDRLSESLFFTPKNRQIFKCIEGLNKSGDLINVNSIVNYAKLNLHDDSLTKQDVLNIIPSSINEPISLAVDKLVDYDHRRMAWALLQRCAEKMNDAGCNMSDSIDSTAEQLALLQGSENGGTVLDANKAIRQLTKRVNENLSGHHKYSILTGFSYLDGNCIIREGTLTVIGATTSSGKTSFAMRMVMNAAGMGIPCAYYSMEMKSDELWARNISSVSGSLSANIILNKKMSVEQMNQYNEGVSVCNNLPVYIDENSTVSFEKIKRSIRSMVSRFNVKMVVIDYLQILVQNIRYEKTVEQYLGDIARDCKNLAQELNISIVLLSQLSRDKFYPHPKISQLRGSGQIEEASDVVLLIDRPESRPDIKVSRYEGDYSDISVKGTAKIIVAKGRSVGQGSFMVGFDSSKTKFYDLRPVDMAELRREARKPKTSLTTTGNEDQEVPF